MAFALKVEKRHRSNLIPNLLFQEKPMFTFANKAGLDMLETSLVALQDLTLDKIFDESGRKALFSDISKLMEQVRTASMHPRQ